MMEFSICKRNLGGNTREGNEVDLPILATSIQNLISNILDKQLKKSALYVLRDIARKLCLISRRYFRRIVCAICPQHHEKKLEVKSAVLRRPIVLILPCIIDWLFTIPFLIAFGLLLLLFDPLQRMGSSFWSASA